MLVINIGDNQVSESLQCFFLATPRVADPCYVKIMFIVNASNITGLNNVIDFSIARALRPLNVQMCYKVSKGQRQYHVF